MKPDPDDTDGQNDGAQNSVSNESTAPAPSDSQSPPDNQQANAEPQNEPGENAGDAVDHEAPDGRKADGTPRRKPGRKAATEALRERLDSVTPAPPRVARAVPTPAPAPIAVDYQALGGVAANLWFNVPQILFGKDWEPEPHEVKPIVGAFAGYFKAQGIDDLPPGWVLAISLISYASVKASKPTVSERIARGIQWAKSKLFRR